MPKAKKARKPKEATIEIARSFSFKLNAGNFESRDFFCSAKKECKESEAEATSEALYEFSKGEVVKSVNRWKAQFKTPDVKKIEDEAKTESQLDAGK